MAPVFRLFESGKNYKASHQNKTMTVTATQVPPLLNGLKHPEAFDNGTE
jgi:hypothetical protein